MSTRMAAFLGCLAGLLIGCTLYVCTLGMSPDPAIAIDQKTREVEKLKARVQRCQRRVAPIVHGTKMIEKDDHLYRCVEIEFPED